MKITIPDDYSIPQLIGMLKNPFPLEAASFFPLGDFWLIVICAFVIYLSYKVIYPQGRRFAMKQLAKLEFDRIKNQITSNNDYLIVQQLSDLIRRVGIVAYGNEKVATLHSNDWISFILENDKKQTMDLESAQTLAQAPYLSDAQNLNIDIETLYKQSYNWSMSQL